MAKPRQALDSSGVATLKHLALAGALDGQTKLSCADLADQLDASTQTASRRLQHLEDGEYVSREIVSDGQWVEITDAGATHLREEYAAYRQIFEGEMTITLTGSVTTGMGEGRHYITLSGYMEQFREELGYEPYAGTLNVDLDEESVRNRAGLAAIEPIHIDGWEADGRTYGPAYCFPATVVTDDDSYEQAHVIAPERTHHGDDHLEIIAPVRLRDDLGLTDGEEVQIDVTER